MSASRPVSQRVTPSDSDPYTAVPNRYGLEWRDRLSEAAFALLAELWLESTDGMTDGYVSHASLLRMKFYRTPNGRTQPRRIAELVDEGYVNRVEDGYQLVGYLARNGSRDYIMERKHRNAKAGRKGGHARAAGAKRGPGGRFQPTTSQRPANVQPDTLSGQPLDRTGPSVLSVSQRTANHHPDPKAKALVGAGAIAGQPLPDTAYGLEANAVSLPDASEEGESVVVERQVPDEWMTGRVAESRLDCDDCERAIEPGQRYGDYGPNLFYHFPTCPEGPYSAPAGDLDALPF